MGGVGARNSARGFKVERSTRSGEFRERRVHKWGKGKGLGNMLNKRHLKWENKKKKTSR